MSSGFVASGQDSEWVNAQQEVENRTQAKNAEGKQHDGKSLFEVLQNNKAAKQEAFEESMKLKNQFRSLDEDEVEFLDAVLESTRAQEAAVQKDTREQLESFRNQQEAAEKIRFEGPDVATSLSTTLSLTPEDSWTTKKKRRRDQNSEVAIGVKVRRLSSKDDQPRPKPVGTSQKEEDSTAVAVGDGADVSKRKAEGTVAGVPAIVKSSGAETKQPVASLLGLGDYSSDED